MTQTASETSESDPILDKFLAFIAHDIQQHPEGMQPFIVMMYSNVELLIEGVELDLNSTLLDEKE